MGHFQKFEIFHHESNEDGGRERAIDREVYGKVTAVMCAEPLQEEQNRAFREAKGRGEDPEVRLYYIRNTRTDRCFFADGSPVRSAGRP